MKNQSKLLFLLTLLLIISSYEGSSQSIVQSDTTKIGNKTEQNTKGKTTASGNDENNGSTNVSNDKSVKQVKDTKPDMSKARGARPTYIQRPSGSGIPRGMGNPSGALGIKPGKR